MAVQITAIGMRGNQNYDASSDLRVVFFDSYDLDREPIAAI